MTAVDKIYSEGHDEKLGQPFIHRRGIGHQKYEDEDGNDDL
ncbi:MAG: hypothetical protein ACOX4J_04610 [Anaerovoracaceae bacterium]